MAILDKWTCWKTLYRISERKIDAWFWLRCFGSPTAFTFNGEYVCSEKVPNKFPNALQNLAQK